MLNNFILVGRLAKELEVKKEGEKSYCEIQLAIPRPFKNEEGIYDTDFITVLAFDTIATNTCDYCKKGDVIGAKGRIQSNENKMELIAERITFLSSKTKED